MARQQAPVDTGRTADYFRASGGEQVIDTTPRDSEGNPTGPNTVKILGDMGAVERVVASVPTKVAGGITSGITSADGSEPEEDEKPLLTLPEMQAAVLDSPQFFACADLVAGDFKAFWSSLDAETAKDLIAASEVEGFYEKHFKEIQPALMTMPQSIMKYSGRAKQAFLTLLGRTGGIPSYGTKPAPIPQRTDQ
jgi:hypothetical protein